MKKDTVNTIKLSLTDLLVLLKRLSKSDYFHGNLEVLVQSEQTGLVNEYFFDKDKNFLNSFHDIKRLKNFITSNHEVISSLRFKFDIVVFDK